MWYYMIKYSFDSTKVIKGPFKTENEAYQAMQHCANEEYRICTEENEWDSEIYKKKDAGEITIISYFDADMDVTEFFIFEI